MRNPFDTSLVCRKIASGPQIETWSLKQNEMETSKLSAWKMLVEDFPAPYGVIVRIMLALLPVALPILHQAILIRHQ